MKGREEVNEDELAQKTVEQEKEGKLLRRKGAPGMGTGSFGNRCSGGR